MVYYCVAIGTGPMANVHQAFLEGYATAFGLSRGTETVNNTFYVCVAIGTGPEADTHRTVLDVYTHTVFDLTATEKDTCC
jgi:hypothetical protein